MKALKSPLAAQILSSPSGAKVIRKWLTGGLPSDSVWHNGVLWVMKKVGKAK